MGQPSLFSLSGRAIESPLKKKVSNSSALDLAGFRIANSGVLNQVLYPHSPPLHSEQGSVPQGPLRQSIPSPFKYRCLRKSEEFWANKAGGKRQPAR